MLNDVKSLLEALGYTVLPGDEWLLDFLTRKIEKDIQSACNVAQVPDALHETAVKMVAGEFLLAKKGADQLNGFDVDGAVKSITEGDVSITFEGTPEQRLDALIDYLRHYNSGALAAYRCIKW